MCAEGLSQGRAEAQYAPRMRLTLPGKAHESPCAVAAEGLQRRARISSTHQTRAHKKKGRERESVRQRESARGGGRARARARARARDRSRLTDSSPAKQPPCRWRRSSKVQRAQGAALRVATRPRGSQRCLSAPPVAAARAARRRGSRSRPASRSDFPLASAPSARTAWCLR